MVREIADRGRTIIFSTHVMEHAERLCDRIILVSGGRKVFDGSTEQALDQAPRRLVISSDDERLKDTLTPFAKDISDRDDKALGVVLKRDADNHAILEKCVNSKIKLLRFEPKPPSLHEAFVALVGKDEAEKMQAGVA